MAIECETSPVDAGQVLVRIPLNARCWPFSILAKRITIGSKSTARAADKLVASISSQTTEPRTDRDSPIDHEAVRDYLPHNFHGVYQPQCGLQGETRVDQTVPRSDPYLVFHFPLQLATRISDPPCKFKPKIDLLLTVNSIKLFIEIRE